MHPDAFLQPSGAEIRCAACAQPLSRPIRLLAEGWVLWGVTPDYLSGDFGPALPLCPSLGVPMSAAFLASVGAAPDPVPEASAPSRTPGGVGAWRAHRWEPWRLTEPPQDDGWTVASWFGRYQSFWRAGDLLLQPESIDDRTVIRGSPQEGWSCCGMTAYEQPNLHCPCGQTVGRLWTDCSVMIHAQLWKQATTVTTVSAPPWEPLVVSAPRGGDLPDGAAGRDVLWVDAAQAEQHGVDILAVQERWRGYGQPAGTPAATAVVPLSPVPHAWRAAQASTSAS